MKKFIAALLLVSMLILPAVSAKADNPGEKITFSLSSSAAFYFQSCLVKLSIVVNPGISAGALNITYDHTKVSLERAVVEESFSADIVSVTDNRFGQVRFTFLSSEGIIRDTGAALSLYFTAVAPQACFSDIALAQSADSVYGKNYTPAPYDCPAGKVTFITDTFRPAPGSPYFINHASKLVTGVPPRTSVSAFRANLEGEFELFAGGALIGTGTRVYANLADYFVAVAGDVDGDGRIAVMDYILLRLSILGLRSLSGAFFAAADVDKSGRVNVTDYILIRMNILGLRSLP